MEQSISSKRLLLGIGIVAFELFINFGMGSRSILFGLGLYLILTTLNAFKESTPAALATIGIGEFIHSAIMYLFGLWGFGAMFVMCMALGGIGLALWLRPVAGNPDVELEGKGSREAWNYYYENSDGVDKFVWLIGLAGGLAFGILLSANLPH